MSTSIKSQRAISTNDEGQHNQLERLAPEILLIIVTQLPDLVSLDSILRASPAVFRLFNKYAVEITEAVLSSGFTHGHIRVIIRIIALIRSSALPIQSLHDFNTQVANEALYCRIRGSKFGLVPERLSETTQPAILRSILASNRQITYLALDCLTHYLARFRALKPEHLVDKKFRFSSTAQDDQFVSASELTPKGQKYQVQDVGHPSWVEEQRVIRAFWRIQVFYDLKKAAHSLLSWPKEDIERLNSMDPVQLYPGQSTFAHLELEEMKSIIDYTREVQPTVGPREVKREWPTPVPGEKDWKVLAHPSPTYLYFRFVSGDGIARPFVGPHSPLLLISFDPFRRLGFALWDSKRMIGYGFMSPPKYGQGDWNHFYFFAWRSILSAEEIAEVVRLNRKRYMDMLHRVMARREGPW